MSKNTEISYVMPTASIMLQVSYKFEFMIVIVFPEWLEVKDLLYRRLLNFFISAFWKYNRQWRRKSETAEKSDQKWQ